MSNSRIKYILLSAAFALFIIAINNIDYIKRKWFFLIIFAAACIGLFKTIREKSSIESFYAFVLFLITLFFVII